MVDRKILVGESSGVREGRSGVDLDSTLGFAAVAGLLIALIGLIDLSLAWFPNGNGDLGWQFATLALVPNAFPTLALGLVVAAAAAGGRSDGASLRFVMVVANALAGVGVLALTVWFVAVYRQASPGMESAVLGGARKALARSLVFGVGFGAMHLVSAIWLARRPRLGSA